MGSHRVRHYRSDLAAAARPQVACLSFNLSHYKGMFAIVSVLFSHTVADFVTLKLVSLSLSHLYEIEIVYTLSLNFFSLKLLWSR